MSRIYFHFIDTGFLKSQEEVWITDTAILIKKTEGLYQIPLRDIKQISACGKDGILIGYGASNTSAYSYIIKSVHSNALVVKEIIRLIKKNQLRFSPISIGFM